MAREDASENGEVTEEEAADLLRFPLTDGDDEGDDATEEGDGGDG